MIPARPVVALLDPGVDGVGLIDRAAHSSRFWTATLRRAGFRVRPVRPDSEAGLAALLGCHVALSIGDGVYPEARGALTQAVIAHWVRRGGVLVELAGSSFLLGMTRGRLEPRWGPATDLFELVLGYNCAERRLHLTPLGRDWLGDVRLPGTLLELNAGTARRLAVRAGLNPDLSLIETDGGESLLGVHRLGAGHLVRWSAGAGAPLRGFLAQTLGSVLKRLTSTAAAPPMLEPAALLDPVLIGAAGGVRVGFSILDPQGGLPDQLALELEVRSAKRSLRLRFDCGGGAASTVRIGEIYVPIRPTTPVDVSLIGLGGSRLEAHAVAELERAPGRFPPGSVAPRRPNDFRAFWNAAKRELRSVSPELERQPLADITNAEVITERFKFSSLDQVRISGVFCRPARLGAPAPGVLVLPGYGCGAMDEAPEHFARLGLCALSIDIRGVGWADSNFQAEGEGLLTHGLESPTRHAYRGGLMDCLRGLELLRAQRGVDRSSIAVVGGSQGGGLALACAALDGQVSAVAASVPFLCDIVRSAALVSTEPLAELKRWLAAHPHLAARAASTLAYVDATNFVEDLACPVLIAYSPRDQVSPAAGVVTALSRLSRPATVLRLREGHMAPALLEHRRRVENWVVRKLYGVRGGTP